MHLVRVDLAITPGRAAAFETWAADLSQTVKYYDGFQFAVLGNSLGSPVHYTNVQRWDSREAFMALFKSDKLREAIRTAQGDGLFQIRRPPEIYEAVWRVGDPAGADFKGATLVEWNVTAAPGRSQAFENDRRALAELRQKHVAGLIAQSLWRYLGGPNRYLVAQAYATVDAVSQGRTAPEVQAYMQAHPPTDYASGPPAIENFEVVLKVNR